MTEQTKQEQIDPTDLKEDTSAKLSTRDALEVALAAEKDKEENERPKEEFTTPAVSEKTIEDSPKYQPPQEWEEEERKLFFESTPAQQKASLNLHEKRARKLTEIQTEKQTLKQEREQLKYQKSIEEAAEQFRSMRGGREVTPQDIKNALTVVNEIQSSDSEVEIYRKILRAKGKEEPEWLKNQKEDEPKFKDPRVDALLKAEEERKIEEERRTRSAAEAYLANQFGEFAATKNADGRPRFSDLQEGNPEELSWKIKRIGSLVNGRDEISQEFIHRAKERNPGLTYQGLLELAYKECGYRVDDSIAPSSPTSQQHIAKSRRAASSVPGRSSHSSVSGPVKLYKTTREAAAAAIAQLRERDGH